MNRSLILALLSMLAGCSSLDGKLTNRLSCTAGGDVALYSSMYGPIGITSYVDQRDSDAACLRADTSR